MNRFSFLIYIFIVLFTAIGADAAPKKTSARIMNGKVAVRNIRTMNTDGRMKVSMDFVLDSLHVAPNRRVVLYPRLRARSGSVSLKPVVINGKRQQIMYARRDHKRFADSQPVVAARKNGTPQTINYSSIADYDEWMSEAILEMEEDMCGCGDIENNDSETICSLAATRCRYKMPVATAAKTWQLHGRAYIDFPVDRIELHPDYRNNPRELQKIIDTINVVRHDTLMTITGIDIHGYASPESPYKHNAKLAEGRATTLKNYVRQLVNLDDSLFSVHSTAEDWDGLRRFISSSTIDNRDDILAIASDSTIEPDHREKLIRTHYPEQYNMMLSTWYPALRHSDYTITCRVRQFTVEEAKELLKTRPQLLSENEMFRVAQTYEPGSKAFNDVMEIAVRMFPNDPTANLNAAVARINAGDMEAAKPYLEKAGDSPEAQEARRAVGE